MVRKHAAPEPLLIAAARTLGKAAGTLVNMTQMLTPEPTPVSRSEPESIKEASHDKLSAATARKNQPKQKRSAIAKKGTAKSPKATARTITSKRRSSRKR